MADVVDAGLEDRGQLGDLAAHLGGRLDRHQHELALDRLVGVQLGDLDHRDQLVELLGDLLERRRLGVDDDRHPAEALVLGGAHCEGHDVEPASREQARDAREHAELVLHEHAQDVVLATHLGGSHG